ncbi:MAG: YidC/Oxa1 family membrane protein insertase [Firmicutes bacterium]|jgi:YidC/Oxa1 family membrane protein insertase|nr:YidC/Oxa1 family membrane protein insertase [Bacillota bacterium]HPU00554.1 YidC/Oxa1 family membrane protein insertase [Bacillota bacterium]
MTEAIARFFSQILSVIYGVIPNFGVAIIILTALLRLVTYPLNQKQLESNRKMQELNPEIQRIRQKYKHDREKQNQAVFEFMQKNNINPMAGCLPLLIQLPILWGIFRMLRDTGTFLSESINTFLIPSLEFVDLALSPNEFQGDLLQQIIYYLFPLLSGASTYIYQKISMTDPNQKMMMYMMPAIFVLISFSFPAGLIIYWITYNLLTMGQHYLFISREKKKEEKTARAEAGKSGKGKKGDRGEK